MGHGHRRRSALRRARGERARLAARLSGGAADGADETDADAAAAPLLYYDALLAVLAEGLEGAAESAPARAARNAGERGRGRRPSSARSDTS